MGINLISLILDIIKEIRHVKSDVRLRKLYFPNIERRLFIWALYTRLTQKKIINTLNISQQEKDQNQLMIDSLTVKFVLFLILLAYDDPIDDGLLSKKEIYDQLSRCLAGFIVRSISNFPISSQFLESEFNKIANISEKLFDISVLHDLHWLLNENDFLVSVRRKVNIEENDLFYKNGQNNPVNLNITIYAAIQMGEIYKQLKCKLTEFGYNNHNQDDNWHFDLILSSLLKSGYAQANTIYQKDIGSIGLEKYIQIACWKSNVYLDIGGCVRNLLTKNLFYETRFNDARFCEQIIDDIVDFDKDFNDGNLNIFNLHMTEQGRTAIILLDLMKSNDLMNKNVTMRANDILLISPLLKTKFEHTFIFQNPIIQTSNIKQNTFDNKDNDLIFAAFINSKKELNVGLEMLLAERAKTWEKFICLWRNKRYMECSELTQKSSIPLSYIESLIKFVIKNKNHIIRDKEFLLAQSIYYYLLVCMLNLYRLKFLIIRSKIILKETLKTIFSPSRIIAYLRRKSHVSQESD